MTAVDDDYGDSLDPPFKRICARYGLAMYFVQLLEHHWRFGHRRIAAMVACV